MLAHDLARGWMGARGATDLLAGLSITEDRCGFVIDAALGAGLLPYMSANRLLGPRDLLARMVKEGCELRVRASVGASHCECEVIAHVAAQAACRVNGCMALALMADEIQLQLSRVLPDLQRQLATLDGRLSAVVGEAHRFEAQRATVVVTLIPVGTVHDYEMTPDQRALAVREVVAARGTIVRVVVTRQRAGEETSRYVSAPMYMPGDPSEAKDRSRLRWGPVATRMLREALVSSRVRRQRELSLRAA